MSTIMQRWVSVKTELAAEGLRILVCAQEAENLIEERCGQFAGSEYRDETRGLLVVTWSAKPQVQILAGSWYVQLLDTSATKHLNVPLSAAEKALDLARLIMTSSFVELWERKEAAKV